MAPSRWGFPVAQAMQRHTGSRVTPSPPLQPALPAEAAQEAKSALVPEPAKPALKAENEPNGA